MKKKIFGMVLMLLPWLAQAALQVDTINGLVYDPVLDVTWLKTPNFAKQDLTDARVTQIITDVGTVAGHTLVQTDFFKDNTGYSGNMTWWGAKAWVQTLNYQGIPGWRLPKITQFDATTGDPVNSELTDLYNREGLLGMTATFGNVQLANAVPADNSAFYWIDNEVSVNGSPIAASIVSGIDGSLGVRSKTFLRFAWAVHDGDVRPVPIPGAIWLFGSGVLGLMGVTGRKRRR